MKFVKPELTKLLVKDKKGFTLVEMIVVIAILVILISIITPQVIGHIESANEAVCSANVNTLVQEYTAKAIWRYTMEDSDAKSMMMDVAEAHGMKFVPYSETGLHSGCIEKVCPSGGTYVCDFTDDKLTVTMTCDKHGSIKLDVIALYEQLAGLRFDTSSGFPYGSIDEYFCASRNNINSEAINTGKAYAPYSSLADAIASELNRQGINVNNRSWRMYKSGTEYSMFLAPSKITKEQSGQWVTCEKYDMAYKDPKTGQVGRVVKGYIKVTTQGSGKNEYPILNGGSFTTIKPKDFNG